MAHNFEVIDADGHITEEDNQLKQYMDARYRDRAATLTPRDSWDRSIGGTLGTRARDARSWLDAMDRGGVSTAVLYPTNGLSVGWIREPDVAVAYSKAWNDFVSEEFQKVSPRLKAVALVPFQDVPEAVKELRRAVNGTQAARCHAAGGGVKTAIGARELLADLPRSGEARLHGRDSCHGARPALFCRRHVRSVYRSSYAVSFLCPNDAVHEHDVPRRF